MGQVEYGIFIIPICQNRVEIKLDLIEENHTNKKKTLIKNTNDPARFTKSRDSQSRITTFLKLNYCTDCWAPTRSERIATFVMIVSLTCVLPAVIISKKRFEQNCVRAMRRNATAFCTVRCSNKAKNANRRGERITKV